MRHAITLATLAACAGLASAQDITLLRIGGSGSDINAFGESNGSVAFVFGTTVCNLGSLPVDFAAGAAAMHPVLAQNLYRIEDGRIVQLGYSFPTHGFCAINEAGCATCQPSSCSTLGAGCASSDPASLSDGGGQVGGTRLQIEAATGAHNHPIIGAVGDPFLAGRVHTPVTEIDSATHPGAVFIFEGIAIAADDHQARNARNNASWRQADLSPFTNPSMVGSTVVGEPAVFAWPVFDAGAVVREAVVADEGGFGVDSFYFVGSKATDLGGGEWRYEYAVQNLNSGRGARSFSVPLGCGANVSAVSFAGLSPHSGDTWDDSPWHVSQTGGSLTWSTDTFASNPDANALRWGMLYNFGFTADQPPGDAQAEVGLFAPGFPAATWTVVHGPCPAIGENTCESTPNSTGSAALISASGSASVAANDLSLSAAPVPGGQFGLFYYGLAASEIQTPFGNGFRCVGGQVYRLDVELADLGDVLGTTVDLADPPQPAGEIMPGTTWLFQAWFRDPAGGGAFFDLSDALRISFLP